MSGSAFNQSVAAMIGPPSGPRTVETYGTREDLRALFEIDPSHVAAATLVELARCGSMPADKVASAIRELGIDPEKLDPFAL